MKIMNVIEKKPDEEPLLDETILDLRERILELRQENLSLNQRLFDLEAKITIRSEVKREDNYYILESDPKQEGRIYCMACFDYEGKLVNIPRTRDSIHCEICEARKRSSGCWPKCR